MTLSVVGKNIPKIEALDQVLGRVQYLDDVQVPAGTLYAKMLGSKYAHAEIREIDCRKAEKLSGVKGIITHKDVPHNGYGPRIQDQAVLAEKARYLGEPVAAVAAETLEIAEEATQLIDVRYEELPAIFDPRDGLKPDAPKIYPDGNMVYHFKIRRGDIEKGFKEADEIIEGHYETPWQQHVQLETHGAIATPHSDGSIEVLCSSQQIFIFRMVMQQILQIPQHKIRMIAAPCGGGFGGKNEVSVEPHAALLALKTKKPVKLVWTREDEFIRSTVRHRKFMDYKAGVKRDGTITAMEVKNITDNGAATGWGFVGLMKNYYSCGPYRVPNVKLDDYLVYTNTQVGGTLRGYMAAQPTFAHELLMDTIAEKLRLDPLELRLKNAFKDGDTTITGQVLHAVGIIETMKKASEAFGWRTKEVDK